MASTRFEIDPEFADELQRLSLDSFDALCGYSGGTIAHEKHGQSVVRIDVDGAARFYLKRTPGDPVGEQLRARLRGRTPHAAAWREYTMIRAIRNAGLPVMRPVAWGEHRRAGLAREAVLLVEAVPGESIDRLLPTLDTTDRQRLLGAIGHLGGRLHAAGFFGPLRARDMICATMDDSPKIVLIDREARDPRPQPYTTQSAARSLARTWLKFGRLGIELTDEERDAVVAGYLGGTGDAWVTTPSGLIDAVRPHVADLTKPGAKYAGSDGHG